MGIISRPDHDIYTDISFRSVDIAKVQEQVTKVVAASFALILSISEFLEYINEHSKGEQSAEES
jgi:hypothetical protein